MQTLLARLFVYSMLGLVLLAGFVEVGCRYGGFTFTQEWEISYELGPWQDAEDIENCRINLRLLTKNEAIEFYRDPQARWPTLHPWHQWLAVSLIVIAGVLIADLLVTSILRLVRRR